ncbi:MAG: serine/threonine protein kinase [Akkermansiaceae bacterium]
MVSLPQSQAPDFGSNFVPPTVEELQKNFPELEILSFVGHGGMGTYYKARHPKLERLAAVKILPVNANADAQLVESFKKEAKAMAALTHLNIIGIYEFMETDFMLYLVMEYVEGEIFERLVNTRYFAVPEILAIITQVCDALNYAHKNGVIHRDLRLGNTFLDQDGLVKIGDFGMARLMGEELFRRRMTESNRAMGTLDYVAPEQHKPGHQVDSRADIYSVGMMTYKLLTRILPYDTFVVPSKLVPNLDPQIDDLVVRCLQEDPNLRFQNVTELWNEVERLREGLAAPDPQDPPTTGPAFNFPEP